MRWAHAFSYGPQNSIEFDKNPLTQFIGKNGHGKSSVALILEEVLYNKNSKGIKKSNILNRHSNSKSYNIIIDSGCTSQIIKHTIPIGRFNFNPFRDSF